MGTCKLLLPWGNKTILVHLLNQWRTLGVAQIAPVIDASNQLLKTALVDARFSSGEWINNFFPERGMFSSLWEASRCVQALRTWSLPWVINRTLRFPLFVCCSKQRGNIQAASASLFLTGAPLIRSFFR